MVLLWYLVLMDVVKVQCLNCFIMYFVMQINIVNWF